MTKQTRTEQNTAELREARAVRLIETDLLLCQSALIDRLIRFCPAAGETADDPIEGFNLCEDVDNLYPDPSDWDIEECRDWLNDHVEIGSMDADSDVDNWRQEVTDNAEAAEIMEWWAVTSALCVNLRSIGEPVLDNDYGYWWGRTCTGQSVIMDGTIQRVVDLIEARCAAASASLANR